MPTTDSNLTGTFIANTYQKILQVDTNYGATGISSYNQTDNITTSKYTVLNGLGQIQKGLTIDSAGDSNAGLFIKDNSNRLMGIQYQDAVDGEGLNFWTPGSINANLFLKNTGSVWVGYTSGSNIPVTSDVSGYSLYVKNGVQVGENATGNNGRINLIGANPLENGSGMFINGEYPFRLVRYFYDQGNTFESFRTRNLRFPSSVADVSQPGLNINNNPNSNDWISVSEWTALIVGFARSQQSDDTPIVNAGCLAFSDGGYWKIGFSFANIAGGGPDQDWLIDVLFIKTGFFNNQRPSGKPSGAGSITDGSRGGNWT